MELLVFAVVKGKDYILNKKTILIAATSGKGQDVAGKKRKVRGDRILDEREKQTLTSHWQ